MFCHKCGVALLDQSSFCPACGMKAAGAPSAPSHATTLDGKTTTDKPKRNRSFIAVAGCTAVAILLVIALASNSNQSSAPPPASNVLSNPADTPVAPQRTTQLDTPAVGPIVKPELPAAEQEFIRAVRDGRTAFQRAPNEMAQGGTRSTRRLAICRSLSGGSVSGWSGQIRKLGSNSDGKGVLEISLAEDIRLETWNNDLSDISDNTLIDPTSSLFAHLSKMKDGDQVVFSGSFLPSDVDCVRETSVTLEGSMTDPEFVFRFTSVDKP